jgi:hypothetical protein|tara:strand:+ start:1086 stop:1337 length:252 start_codon:yes stop_codon:yes gene_type:complete
MPFNVKLREQRTNAKLRDGRGLGAPMHKLTTDEFVLFEHRPTAEDPNLIIEEVAAAPAKKKRKRKKAEQPAAPAETAETPAAE